MTKNKGLGFSVFLTILMIFMVISVIFTFSISYMFSTDGVSGKIFGKYVYIMETADMEPEIDKGAAVISDADGITVLVEGNVILFKNGEREDVMRIRQVVHNTENTVYVVSPDSNSQNTLEVKKDNVIAKCTTEGKNLGGFISFLSSIPGILIFMIVPCIVILAIIVSKILAMKKADNANGAGSTDGFDDYDEDDDDDEFIGFNGRQMKSSPLFDPESDINPGEDFERKKSSIAQNFSQKPGAQIKKPKREKPDVAPKAAVEKFKAAVEEKPNAPVSKKVSLAPENSNGSKNDKLSAIKSALMNQNEDDGFRETAGGDASEDKTVAFRPLKPSRVDTYIGKPADIKPEPAKKKPTPRKPAAKKPEPVSKPTSKSDNINSIDDLIKALEEEKKKL